MVKQIHYGTRHPGILSILRDKTFMTKDEAAIEALICTEIANAEQYLALSVALPFKKCLDKSLRKPSARLSNLQTTQNSTLGSMSAATLRRTAHTSEWFSAARELDVEWHTQFGALNYLPPDLRDQVWTYVVEDDKTSNCSLNGTLREKATYEHFDLLGPV
ncbi:hypothetical protein N7G274_004842 [Stereocaulon virgatum]|uniref:Uncharacterized protein n=1 Tax=Stereocaulon virgatum TaxID=373712 RepID=A0ABR4AG35_9LECA